MSAGRRNRRQRRTMNEGARPCDFRPNAWALSPYGCWDAPSVERCRRSMRSLAVFVAALLMLGPLGCAHRAALMAPPPFAVPVAPVPKSDIGTVGLVVQLDFSSSTFQRPGVVGAGEGAKAGAKTGAKAPLLPGLFFIRASMESNYINGLVLGLYLTGAGLVLAPVGAVVGAAAGALAAPSKAEVEQSEAALERAFADINFPDALSAWIIEAGGERQIISVADPAAPAVDTFLKLDSFQVSLASKNPTDWKPGLRLRVALSGKLIRASDGEEIRAWSWEHEGRKADFVDWGKDDARLFRAEFEHAGRALATEIIGDVF